MSDTTKTINPAPETTVIIRCTQTTSGISTSVTVIKSGKTVLDQEAWYIACTKFSPAVLPVITAAVAEAKAEANGTTVEAIKANQAKLDAYDKSYDTIVKTMSL